MNQGISCDIMQWGEELIAKGKAFNSDLVILDAGHPGLMDFARTIDYIKENFPGVAILLSSAGPVRHEFEEYIDEADGIIYKPYNRESVLNALARVSSARAIKGGTADVGA